METLINKQTNKQKHQKIQAQITQRKDSKSHRSKDYRDRKRYGLGKSTQEDLKLGYAVVKCTWLFQYMVNLGLGNLQLTEPSPDAVNWNQINTQTGCKTGHINRLTIKPWHWKFSNLQMITLCAWG